MRTPIRCLSIAIAAMLWAAAPRAHAQVNMSSTSSYSQVFNTLGTAASNPWAENSTLASWYWQSGAGSTALATYVGSTGTGTSGAGYSYGSAALPGDRATGSLCSNTSGALAYGLLLRNTSGISISSITVAYTGEQWRNGGNTTAQVLSFYYRTFTAVSTTLNPASNGTWTNLPVLNFTGPVATATAAALDGNASGNRSVLPAAAVPVTLANNDYLFIKWDDPNDTGNDHGLSIDDVTVSWVVNSVTPNVGFAPASNTVTEGATQTVNVTMDIAPSSAVTVNVADALTGSASSGPDYTPFTTTALTFPVVGTYPLTQTVSIATINDAAYEATETVNLSLALSSGTANISPSSYQLSVLDNDPLPLVLNEVDYDNPGTDNAEFVEIKNTGATPINIGGFKIELVNGATGGAVVYTTITLPSFSLAGGAYYVVGNNASIPNINLVVTPATDLMQNGSPDAVGLRDPSNVLLDAVSYEGNSGTPYTESTGILIANSDDATAGIGISRFPDGADTQVNSTDWSRRCLSPGATNNASSTNCICTPPAATAVSQCINNTSWEIVVSVTSTGSGSTVNITNDVNGSIQLNVGVGNWTIGPFNNNAVVNVTVAHQTFALCNLTLSGFFLNCQPDCNNVVGGPDVPGAPCDDLNAGTTNDVWSPACVCAGTPIVPLVGFISPTSTVTESGIALTIGLEMDIAPTGPVVVNVTDLLTGTATSGADYGAIGTLQFTFLPSDTYPYLQTFNVTINDDADYEPTETFNLNLAVQSGTASTSTSNFVGVITSEDLPTLRINEVDYDNAGTDNAEWIELKNTGGVSFNIAGFAVQLINGNLGGAAVYKTIILPSFTLAAGGYYVIGNSAAIPNLNLLQTPATDMIQNGSPDAVGLRDPFNTLIDAISYEGNTGAPYTETSGLPLAQPDDNVLAAKVIARYLDGNDTNNNSVDWKVWCATPGASNATVDADSDGIPNCLDNCPNLAGVQGNTCDDLNTCTINDVITNACVCAGTFQDTDLDGVCDVTDNCPTVFGQVGSSCNDANACTINDVLNASCVCVGTFQDTDGDGVCDANDNCPTVFGQVGSSCNDADACTINDVLNATCICAGTFQDTDSDGVCDATDNCPTVFGQIGSSCNDANACTINDVLNASCVCVGTFQDTDGDGACDANDNCPTVFGQVGSSCNDADVCTINDVLNASCVCAGTFQDTDGDGVCDATDNCPTVFGQVGSSCNDANTCTINDVLNASCVCAGIFQDTDGDGLCDANDNCPSLFGQQGDACNDNDACTINDVITNACVCVGTFQDTDGDGVCDANDNCPTVFGQVGSSCNDNNCFTINDALNASCVCVGTVVPCDNWTLTIDAGTDGSQIAWQIIEAGGPCVLASGGPYGNGTTNAPTICVPQGGCFNLTFTDDANGIAGGGWRLTDNNGRRILDNTGNGGCFSSTSTTAQPFCNEPASAQTVIATHCDKENWLLSNTIIASANAAVSAQYGVGDQTDDGYQFWFQSPCGGYSRRIFRNHAISGGQGPANAIRATKLTLNTMVTNPLPIGQLLNVRVRARVNGLDGAWGPACRFKVDPSACTVTQLNPYIASPNYSCGVSGKVVGASGNTGKIFANVVTSGGIPATHYRFEFSVTGEGYLRNVVSTTAVCVLGVWQTNPLLCGTYTYDVRVQASFNGGSTYCPFGPICTLGITNNQPSPYCTLPGGGGGMMEQGDTRADETDGGYFAMYPNPNDGTRLFLQMGNIAESVITVTVDIYDAMGKRVSAAVMPVSASAINTVIELDNAMSNGLYFVTITSGNEVRTERLVIQ